MNKFEKDLKEIKDELNKHTLSEEFKDNLKKKLNKELNTKD